MEDFLLKNVEYIWQKLVLSVQYGLENLPSEPSSVTVIKDCANRYFLSFVVDVQPIQSEANNPKYRN